MTTDKVEEEVPLFEQSDDWVLQFGLAYNEDGQRKNGRFLAHIATTGKRPDGIMFSENLKSVMCWNSPHRRKKTLQSHTSERRTAKTS